MYSSFVVFLEEFDVSIKIFNPYKIVSAKADQSLLRKCNLQNLLEFQESKGIISSLASG